MAGQTVKAELKRHEFLFGCGIFWLMDLLNPSVPPERKAVLQTYWEAWSELFNYGTLPFYQGSYESVEEQTRETDTLRAARFLQERGCAVKGHPLCWHTVSAKWLLAKDDEAVLANSWHAFAARWARSGSISDCGTSSTKWSSCRFSIRKTTPSHACVRRWGACR